MSQALKDAYDQTYIDRVAQACSKAHPSFPAERFVQSVFDDQWQARELKSRSQHIRHCLHQALDMPYEKAITVLMEVAPEFGGYEALFFPDFVEAYGQQHWDLSMEAMQWLTRFSSAEFAVRPFIQNDPIKMMAQMQAWSEHENDHVRRLASEGSRPRLPWGQALPIFKKDPSPILPILENLKQDDSDYVRRSVANNLNDIAKDNAEVTIDWARRNRSQHPHTDWIIKHGCRTLLKQAHPEVLALFGYHPADEIEVSTLWLGQASIRIGDTLSFEFTLNACKGQLGRLRIEYGIDYVKANGQLSRKIFKISEGEFDGRERLFGRSQSFRQMTTRKHYPGVHGVAVLINGEEKARATFELK
ncbi:DNA alkylation repair protein [Pontibacterium granulatum]|uniref:DNA alkylation repair protein n=1 Tax=Pontibacterium granulatum TaxID=2036029 RepID=UPI00249A01AB|nr:DNA alkylation repair protein [Pontibacterium granulatum]MDI3326799.1 DNA alkylation repair protein [Pontibacterium granulatum]